MQMGERKSTTSESPSVKEVDPNEMERGVTIDKEYGCFGKNAVIWMLSRTKEIGLNNGKPRKLARLLVVKNEEDKTPRKYLLKRLPYLNEKRRKKFLKEIESHRHVCSLGGSDYISRFYGARDCVIKTVNGRPTEGKLDYVMELGSEGDILSWVQGRWNKFGAIRTREEQEIFLKNHLASVKRIIAQVAFAVKQCFNAHIVHFDLKLENVVMTKILDDELHRYESKMTVNGLKFDWCVKLIDFGLARHFPGDNWEYGGGRKGTPRYMAPEMASNQSMQDARNADIWPIGVMLWECLTGMPLWKEAVERTTKPYREMRKSKGFKRWFNRLCSLKQNQNFSQFVPKDAIDMLDKIFAYEPNRRLSIDNMVKHKFLISQMPKYHGITKQVTSSKDEEVEIEKKTAPTATRLRSMGLIEQKFDLENKDEEKLDHQQATEQVPGRVERRENCRARCIAVLFWFKTWSLYTLIIVGYIVAAPFWLMKSGFWDFHAYWSIFSAGLPLIVGLFLYHAWCGKSSSEGQQSGERHKFTSSAWDVGMKPLVTELSLLSSLAVAVMWITNESWTNINLDHGEPYDTKVNGYVILGCLSGYRILSSIFFYLRAREMDRTDSIRIGLSQLVGIRIYWDVEKACKLRRQTTAIREHKILEGVLNAFIFLLVGMYYYFEKSVGIDDAKEASWLAFASILALISVALVLNMGDVLGISVKTKMWWRDMILIVFRMGEVMLRVAAIAVFAACVSARYMVIIFVGDVFVLCLLSYLNCIIINTNRFEFEKQPVITKFVKWVLSSIYGMIACPLLHQWKWWYPIKVLHDGLFIYASYQITKDNNEASVWDEAATEYMLFGGTAIFFILGIMTYFVIDWDQYRKIIDFKKQEDNEEGEDVITKIIAMCETQPELLSRFLVSGVLRVSTVKAQAVRNWDQYGKTRSWLHKHGFYELIESEVNPLVSAKTELGVADTITRRRSDAVGTMDIEFNLDEIYSGNVKQFSNDLSSYSSQSKALCMSISQDGMLLAVGLEDKPFLVILELPSMKTMFDLKRNKFIGAVTGLAFKKLDNGELQLITISEDAMLRVYDVARMSQRNPAGLLQEQFRERISGIKRELKKSTYNIRCLAMDYTNTNFAVGDGKCIWFYNITNKNTSQLQGHTDEITAIKFFPNESTKFVTGSKDKTVRIWDWGQQDLESHMIILDIDNEWSESVDIIRTVDINSTGTAIACGCINGYVIIWGKQNDQEWKVEARINAYNWVNSLNFLPKSENGNPTLIIHTRPHKTAHKPYDDRLKNGYSAMWDYKSGGCLRTLVQPKHAVECSCVFQHERKLKLLTGSWSDKDKHYVILWDLDNNIKGQLSDHQVLVM